RRGALMVDSGVVAMTWISGSRVVASCARAANANAAMLTEPSMTVESPRHSELCSHRRSARARIPPTPTHALLLGPVLSSFGYLARGVSLAGGKPAREHLARRRQAEMKENYDIDGRSLMATRTRSCRFRASSFCRSW